MISSRGTSPLLTFTDECLLLRPKVLVELAKELEQWAPEMALRVRCSTRSSSIIGILY